MSLLIGGNLEGWSLNLSRWHHKLMNILFFEDYIKYRPFLNKIKEAPLGNMLIFMYNNFQKLFCKDLSENWPVCKLVNANEPGQTTRYQIIIWYKNVHPCIISKLPICDVIVVMDYLCPQMDDNMYYLLIMSPNGWCCLQKC